MIMFEDNREDILSKLFRQAYEKDTSDKFVYCEGNDKLVNEVDRAVRESNEPVYVLLDATPDNKNIHSKYMRMSRINKEIADNKLWVFPIVCAEYYFIKAFKDKRYLCCEIDIDSVIAKEDFRDSKIIETERDIKFARNFERFCKLITKKCYIDCMKHTREVGGLNSKYERFYIEDCLCDECSEECTACTVHNKSVRYLREYPCVPTGIVGRGDRYCMNNDELTNVHRHLVDEYNEWMEKWAMKGIVKRNWMPYMH